MGGILFSNKCRLFRSYPKKVGAFFLNHPIRVVFSLCVFGMLFIVSQAIPEKKGFLIAIFSAFINFSSRKGRLRWKKYNGKSVCPYLETQLF